MADASVPAPDSPREVLAGLGDLTRRVRAAQRGTWFPLLLLGVLTLGGIPVSHFLTEVVSAPCPAVRPAVGTGCTMTRHGSPVYWPLGLALAYTATAVFYLRRARNRGVGSRVGPYVLTGIALVALVTATALWGTRHGIPQPGRPIDVWGLHLSPASGAAGYLERLTGNATAVGLPLLVLSWVERSRGLLLLTLVYLAVELVPATTRWVGVPTASSWSDLSFLGVPGMLLLLGALGFGLTELSGRRNTA